MKPTTKKLFALLLVFTLLLSLAACKKEGDKTPEITTTVQDTNGNTTPAATDPEPTTPGATDGEVPVATDPEPTTPAVTDPEPTTPAPTTPVPTTAAPLVITRQPVGQNITEANATVKFSVAVSGGTAPYTYKWYAQDSKAIDKVFDTVTGADTASVSVQVTGSAQAGKIWCVITDAAGKSITSEKAELTVKIPLTLTKHPTGESKTAGEWVYFTVRVSGGSGSYLYRWYTDISGKETEILDSKYAVGARTGELSLWTQRSDRTGSVWCVVEDARDGKKLTSDKATLTLVNPLYISTHPADTTAVVGGYASFHVRAGGGTAPYTYQWYCGDGQTEAAIPGATGRDLTLTGYTLDDSGLVFWCVVKDAAGAEDTSAVVVLTVIE